MKRSSFILTIFLVLVWSVTAYAMIEVPWMSGKMVSKGKGEGAD